MQFHRCRCFLGRTGTDSTCTGESPCGGFSRGSGGTFKGKFNPQSYREVALWPSPWLTARAISQETCEAYGVFHYRNDARKSQYNDSVLMPFRDSNTGEIAEYMSRNIGEVTDERPKYRIRAELEKSKYLFGASEIKNGPVKACFVVESAWTMMKFRQLGFDAVGLYGWSVSSEQASILQPLSRGLISLPDRNKRTDAEQFVSELASVAWLRSPEFPADIQDPEKLADLSADTNLLALHASRSETAPSI